MKVERLNRPQITEILWNWNFTRGFPGILCKELLNQTPEYFCGWATIETQEEFLSLQIRDHAPSKCLTPAGESRALSDVIERMWTKNWKFAQLATESPDTKSAPRKPKWFASFAWLEEQRDLLSLGPLAIHPRNKHAGPVAAVHEIYEGQHRALILADRFLRGEVAWAPIRLLYLWPDREK